MKKKFLWFAALFAALALIVTGCPTGGGTDKLPTEGEDVDLAEIFSGTTSISDEAIITINGNSFTVTPGTSTTALNANLLTADGGFDASEYLGFTFEYKSTIQVNVGIASDTSASGTMWLIDDWGACIVTDDWIKVECLFEGSLMKAWGDETAFDPSQWFKLWIGAETFYADSKFEVRNFEFITDPNAVVNPDPPLSADSTFTEGGATLSDIFKAGTGASLASSSSVKIGKKGETKVIQVAPEPKVNSGVKVDEFRLGINLNPALDLSDAEKLVLSWISGTQTQGNFNIKFTMANYTTTGTSINTNDAALEATDVGNSSGEIDFVDDHASDWGGWEGPEIADTDGKCTFIEIFSNDPRLKRQFLYFTEIDIPDAKDWEDDDVGGETIEASNWYLTDTENGSVVAGNSVTGTGSGDDAWYVYIYFDPDANLDDVILTYTVTGASVIKQCAYDAIGTWGWGYGDVTSGSNFGLSGGSYWSGSGTALDKATLKGICLKMDGDGTFTLTKVEIVTGGGSGGSVTVEADEWYLSATDGGSAAAGNSVTGTNDDDDECWYVYIYFKPDADLKDVILTFTVTGATIIKQCVYDATGTWGWGWGSVTSGNNFDLSGAGSWGASGEALDKATLNGICLKMEGDGTFALTKVEIVK
jgi:hypothetical protein